MHKNTTTMLISCQYIYLIHRNAFSVVYIIILRILVQKACRKSAISRTLFKKKKKRSPAAWSLRQYCSIFLHNTDANMLCRLFDDRKYMDISSYTLGILLSWKTTNLFVFFRINLWTLVTFTFKPCKLRKMFAQSQ